jgi:hypothetical protein
MNNLCSLEHQRSNGKISEWDVSKVSSMAMFYLATAFNGDISEWDVSSSSKFALCSLEQLFNRYFQMGRLFRHQHGDMFCERQRSMAIFPNGMSLCHHMSMFVERQRSMAIFQTGISLLSTICLLCSTGRRLLSKRCVGT